MTWRPAGTRGQSNRAVKRETALTLTDGSKATLRRATRIAAGREAGGDTGGRKRAQPVSGTPKGGTETG
ncbi:hypothetical protein MTBGP_11880 [Moorella thermoacetica]